MKLLTVICESSGNPIADITALLSDNGIDIRDIDFQQMGDNAFLSLAVSQHDRSLALLMNAGYQTVSNEIVLLRGEDRPGALAEISRMLMEQGVAIRSLTLMANNAEGALIALATSDNEKVRAIFAGQIVN